MYISESINQLITQAKTGNFQNSANFSELLSNTSSFDEVFEKVKDMLGSAKSLNDKLGGAKNEQIAQAIDDAATKLDEIKQSSQGIGDDDLAAISKSLQKQIDEDEKLFKTFDFMPIMNQLIYGNLDEAEKSKLYKKASDIAASVKS